MRRTQNGAFWPSASPAKGGLPWLERPCINLEVKSLWTALRYCCAGRHCLTQFKPTRFSPGKTFFIRGKVGIEG